VSGRVAIRKKWEKEQKWGKPTKQNSDNEWPIERGEAPNGGTGEVHVLDHWRKKKKKYTRRNKFDTSGKKDQRLLKNVMGGAPNRQH